MGNSYYSELNIWRREQRAKLRKINAEEMSQRLNAKKLVAVNGKIEEGRFTWTGLPDGFTIYIVENKEEIKHEKV